MEILYKCHGEACGSSKRVDAGVGLEGAAPRPADHRLGTIGRRTFMTAQLAPDPGLGEACPFRARSEDEKAERDDEREQSPRLEGENGRIAQGIDRACEDEAREPAAPSHRPERRTLDPFRHVRPRVLVWDEPKKYRVSCHRRSARRDDTPHSWPAPVSHRGSAPLPIRAS